MIKRGHTITCEVCGESLDTTYEVGIIHIPVINAVEMYQRYRGMKKLYNHVRECHPKVDQTRRAMIVAEYKKRTIKLAVKDTLVRFPLLVILAPLLIIKKGTEMILEGLERVM